MKDKVFYDLWQDALMQPDKETYIRQHSFSDWYDKVGKSTFEFLCILEDIHNAAHITVKEIILKTGLTQKDFAIKFCIPLRTVEQWATNKFKCADYLRLMFCRQLNIINF